MKSAVVLSLLLILCEAFSCKTKIPEEFTTDFHAVVIIPRQPANISDTIFSEPVATNVHKELQTNSVNSGQIESIKLQAIKLTIASPPGQTFAFLQNVQVFISADGAGEMQIANEYLILDKGRTLVMDPDIAELKTYLLANSFKMKLIVQNGAPVTADLSVSIQLKFQIITNLLIAPDKGKTLISLNANGANTKPREPILHSNPS